MIENGPPSTAVEDYLKAIHACHARGISPVSTNALAERLQLTAGSVSAMLRRLAELELVKLEPYRGVTLTPAGERVALKTIRKHRLIEQFLFEVLDVPWDRIHDEAERLEHAISDDLAERIAAKLGNPQVDPHGDPIPNAELQVATAETKSLDQFSPGETVTFERISDSNSEMLRYLADRGLEPGCRLTVVGVEPFGGPITVLLLGADHAQHSLGLDLAQSMRVAASAS